MKIADTTVTTAQGAVRGSLAQGIHAFKGIPYAEPLAGAALWLPPRPRAPWGGVRDATRYGDACLQFSAGARLPIPRARGEYLRALDGMQQSKVGDDSLLLNVWTPSVDAGAKLPVMVWIHGGGFSGGVANEVYDGTPHAQRGVVSVVIQYRLGPPGFLHGSGLFDGETCADNRAFADMLLALRWVQENIARFGGDAGNVTLHGESAGAFAIYQLAASPQAKGLFHRAIAMGGMAETCGPADEYHQVARDALATVGVKPGDAAALAALDPGQILRLQKAWTNLVFRKGERYGSLGKRRVGWMGAATGTAFLPKEPLDSYPHGTPNGIDLMLGTCSNDGGLFSLVLPFSRTLSAKVFGGNFAGLTPRGDMEALRAHYRATLAGASALEVHNRVNNDSFYRAPTLRAAEAHSAGHPGRTFHYELFCPSRIAGLDGIHGIDVALLFNSGPLRGVLVDDEATRAQSAAVMEAWTTFAKTGVPSARGLPAWKPFTAEARHTMVLDRPARLEADIDAPLLGYFRRHAA